MWVDIQNTHRIRTLRVRSHVRFDVYGRIILKWIARETGHHEDPDYPPASNEDQIERFCEDGGISELAGCQLFTQNPAPRSWLLHILKLRLKQRRAEQSANPSMLALLRAALRTPPFGMWISRWSCAGGCSSWIDRPQLFPTPSRRNRSIMQSSTLQPTSSKDFRIPGTCLSSLYTPPATLIDGTGSMSKS